MTKIPAILYEHIKTGVIRELHAQGLLHESQLFQLLGVKMNSNEKRVCRDQEALFLEGHR